MNQKDQIAANVRKMREVAAKIQADINEAGMGPPGGSDNSSAPAYPHLHKPIHTTSYVSYISVPEDKARAYSAAIDFLRMPGERANSVVIESVIGSAIACGWDPDES